MVINESNDQENKVKLQNKFYRDSAKPWFIKNQERFAHLDGKQKEKFK